VRYPFETHIEEGKLRGTYCFVALSLALCTSYMCSTELLFLCMRPLLSLDKSFIFTELTEAFYVTLKMCALWSLGSICPLLLYHTWCFIAPASFPLERERWGVLCLMCSCFVFVAIISTYNIVLPQAASVLLTFEVTDPAVSIQLQARIGPYIDLSLKIALLAVVILQFPLVFGISFHLGALNPRLLTDNRKLLLLMSLMIAALVSPPDVSVQCTLALFFSLCWEIVALLGFIIFQLNTFIRHPNITLQ
jgi:sec-independent protein translocase protein TatC